MLWTLLALLAWVVLGGFLSYYGDLQGRRWGKKRVSWFGLRPKYTAVLITSLTGAVIALLSIATLLVIAPTVRDVVLRGEQAIRENKDVVRDSDKARREATARIREMNAQYAIAKAQLETSQADVENQKLEVKAITLQRQDLEKKNATTSAQYAALSERLTGLQAELQRKRSEVDKQIRELALRQQENRNAQTVNRDLGVQNLDLSQQNGQMEKQNRDLQTANAKILKDNAALTASNQDLQAKRTDLDYHNAVLETVNRRLSDDNTKATQRSIELERQVQEAAAKQDDLYTQLAGENRTFSQAFSSLRQQPLTIRAGGELARRIVTAHSRLESVQRDLAELVSDADATALVNRAGQGDNGRAVRLIAVNKQVLAHNAMQGPDEQAGLDAMAHSLEGRDRDTVVIASSVANSFQGEQAQVELNASPVAEIFPAGAVIATRRIEAHKPIEQIVDTLVQFLQKDVREAAVGKGFVPKVDPTTGELRVGMLTTANLVELTERVRRLGRDVQITAIAAAPTTSADYPIRLTFQITRPPALAPAK